MHVQEERRKLLCCYLLLSSGYSHEKCRVDMDPSQNTLIQGHPTSKPWVLRKWGLNTTHPTPVKSEATKPCKPSSPAVWHAPCRPPSFTATLGVLPHAVPPKHTSMILPTLLQHASLQPSPALMDYVGAIPHALPHSPFPPKYSPVLTLSSLHCSLH